LASDVQGRSSGTQHEISGGQLLLHKPVGSGRMRLHDSNNLDTIWDFAVAKGGT